MEDLRCSSGGNMNESKFNEPMPWIGIYIVAASLAISVAMAADTIHGLRYRKFWFPSKFFAFNATSLTLIAVVVKLSVDLNTAMPQRQDQLAKLSSAVLICTVMGNSMPSIGTMENKEIFMNVMALGILVITLVVNICIQLATGAIYTFWKEHIFIMLLMLVLLLILSFSALTVPTTKNYFEMKYSRKYEVAVKESLDQVDKSTVVRLRNDLMKYWIMAHTCCPQYVMGRSVTCTASGAFCLLAALTLAEAMLRTYLMPWSFKFCTGQSDYKWSTTLILITQTIAVGVGTIAPTSRWFTAINFRCLCPKRVNKGFKDELKVEGYWTQKLLEMKESPLTFKIHGRHYRKFAHDVRKKLLDICIGVQTGIVIVSKLIRLISILFVGRILLCIHCCNGMRRKFKSNSISSDSGLESQATGKRPDLSYFVLHLEGEEDLVEKLMTSDCNVTDHWIRMGRKKQPEDLIHLLEKSTQGLDGVREFDSDKVPSLDYAEPPNCWALPLVTLASIAAALPNTDHSLLERLMQNVNLGLMYVRHIEMNLDAKRGLINIRKAASMVWLGVDLYHRWLDVDLRKMASQAKSPMEILEELSNIAKERFMELKEKHTIGGCITRDSPSKWPVKVLAANSMYRVSQTILLEYGGGNYKMAGRLFEGISIMIADILGACFTNLPLVISRKCNHSSIEEREESVRQAIFLLGKSEKILKILDQKALPGLNPDEMTCINEWRFVGKLNRPLPCISSSSESGTASPSPNSPDFYISVE